MLLVNIATSSKGSAEHNDSFAIGEKLLRIRQERGCGAREIILYFQVVRLHYKSTCCSLGVSASRIARPRKRWEAFSLPSRRSHEKPRMQQMSLTIEDGSELWLRYFPSRMMAFWYDKIIVGRDLSCEECWSWSRPTVITACCTTKLRRQAWSTTMLQKESGILLERSSAACVKKKWRAYWSDCFDGRLIVLEAVPMIRSST